MLNISAIGGHILFDCGVDGIISNCTSVPIYKIFDIEENSFEFAAYVQNMHNSTHEKYLYTDETGNNIKINSPAWGIVCELGNGVKYIAEFRNLDIGDWEYTSEVCMNIRVVRLENEKVVDVVAEQDFDASIVELYNSDNYVSIKSLKNVLSLKIGKRYEQEICSLYLEDKIRSVGFILYPAAKIKVCDMMFSEIKDHKKELITEWSEAEISNYLQHSSDNLEGYWVSLDRTLEESLLKMGGDYKLAMIRSDSGYDLLYLEGAMINADNWSEGMRKAKLIITDIPNVYDVIWYDSQMLPLSKDIIAQIENGNVMTITFPYQKSKIRLYNLPSTGSSSAPRHTSAE